MGNGGLVDSASTMKGPYKRHAVPRRCGWQRRISPSWQTRVTRGTRAAPWNTSRRCVCACSFSRRFPMDSTRTDNATPGCRGNSSTFTVITRGGRRRDDDVAIVVVPPGYPLYSSTSGPCLSYVTRKNERRDDDRAIKTGGNAEGSSTMRAFIHAPRYMREELLWLSRITIGLWRSEKRKDNDFYGRLLLTLLLSFCD